MASAWQGLLARSYVKPFRNRKLAAVYLATFVGTWANSFLSLYVAIDMIRLGWQGFTAYSLAWFVPAGLVLFPAFYVLYTRFSRRGLVGGVFASQALGLVLFIMTPLGETPWGLGLLTALFATGYWQMYHGNMASHTTGGEVGFEASMARAMSSFGKLGGASLAGVLAGHGAKSGLLLAAFGCIFVATLLFGKVFPKVMRKDAGNGEISITSFRQTLLGDWPMTLGTMLEACWELFVGSALSVALILMGISLTVVGVSQGMQGMALLLFVPILGRHIHERKGGEFIWSSGLGMGSLGLFLLSSLPLLVVVGRMLGALSSFCYSGGLESRWYAKKCLTQILIREMNLTVARMLVIPPAAWLCFAHPRIFVALGLGVAALMVPIGRRAVARSDAR